MLLTADTVTNFNNMHSCIPFQIKKKKTNATIDIDDDLMRVNTFFAHFIKEIDTRRYGDNIRILPTNNTINIYRYYDAMLKHMPDDALKTYDETLLYSKTAIKLANNVHRRPNNTDNSSTDDNLDDRIDKFHDLLGKKKIYRIPLRFLIDLGLVNFPISFDTRYILTLERDFKQVV